MPFNVKNNDSLTQNSFMGDLWEITLISWFPKKIAGVKL